MIVLGVDPGMKNTGLGVVRLLPRGQAEVLAAKTIVDLSTPRTFDGVADTIIEYEVEAIALLVFETSLRTQNGRPVLLKSSSLTQRTIGACEVAAHLAGIPCHHYDETEVKEGIGGKKTASKKVVEAHAKLMLGWSSKPKGIDGHAMDAIAVCLYHHSVYGLGNRILGR